jgi:hypothetical protein
MTYKAGPVCEHQGQLQLGAEQGRRLKGRGVVEEELGGFGVEMMAGQPTLKAGKDGKETTIIGSSAAGYRNSSQLLPK